MYEAFIPLIPFLNICGIKHRTSKESMFWGKINIIKFALLRE